MRAFEFRLENVLTYQQRKKKLAEVRRQQALQVLRTSEAVTQQLQEQLRQTAEGMRRAMAASGGAVWEAYSTRSRRLGAEISDAEKRQAQARDEYLKANEVFKQVAVFVEALENMRQRRWQEHKEELAAREQQRLDELVLRRWQQAAPDGEEEARHG